MLLPKGRKAIRGKWVFKIKDYNEDGEPVRRFKTRQITKDFLQKYKIDFDQIWALITGYDKTRLLIIYVTQTQQFVY